MDILKGTKPISPYQFAVFRVVFGLYLTVHFGQLFPYAGELFSGEGVIGDARLNPLYGLFPNPLAIWDDPIIARLFLATAVVLSFAFTAGVFRRSTAILLWFLWACLFHRNNLISNPGIPYVGLLLILCALLPPGDRLSIASIFRRDANGHGDSWQFPALVYWTAWILLAAGYTFSGLVKLGSPSWVNGEAMTMLLENPLARNGIFRQMALELPSFVLKLLTWSALGLELIFLFASFSRLARMWTWTLMIGMHLGIVLVVDFADLTLGMLMIHLFVLDPDWFPEPARLVGKRNVVFFDGVCLMCNATVKFLAGEDHKRTLYFAPLQGIPIRTLPQQATYNGQVKSGASYLWNPSAPRRSRLTLIPPRRCVFCVPWVDSGGRLGLPLRSFPVQYAISSTE